MSEDTIEIMKHRIPFSYRIVASCILCISSIQLLADESRPSYESLTENRGTFLWMQQRREELERKRALEKAEQEKNQEKNNISQIADTSNNILESESTQFPSTPEPQVDPIGQTPDTTQAPQGNEGALINFNNVSIGEVLKYTSRLTGKNFIYNPDELQFSITMISDSETSIEELMAMLLQNLQINGFSLIEQGNGFIIHANQSVRGVNELYQKRDGIHGPQIVTQVFTLQNVEAERCAAIVRIMLSKDAIVEVIESAKIIVSDLAENIQKLSEIIKKLDTQSSGLEIGQYVTINLSPAIISSLTERIMTPLAGTKSLIFVPHTASNSVFIVSTPYLIERTLSVMQTLDLNQARSGFLSGDDSKFDPKLAEEARRRLKEEEEALIPIPPEVSKEDIQKYTRRMLEQELLARGFTQAQIDSMTDEEARALLWQDMNSINEAKKRALKRREMYTDSDLPIGTVEATQFLIYKLQYRKSEDVVHALRAISVSLMSANGGGGTALSAAASSTTPAAAAKSDIVQSDLVITLNSLQSVEDNNTIVFTGTMRSLQKVRELISQIDIPVRQVFIEALVLNTTLANSLEFGVEWGAKIERTNFGSQIGFLRPDTSSFGTAFQNIQQTTPVPIQSAVTGGLSAGAIGRKIKFQGKGFRSTGALINALHHDDETHVIMNPKITTEHNIPAEIFVGSNVPIKGQSIANSTSSPNSSLVTTNYNTAQVGVLLKLTALISSHDTVTLIIEQKVSSTNQAQVQAQGTSTAPPATVNEIRTTTRVHLPSDHFLVISGMIQEEQDYRNDRIPCLGGLPWVGSLFGSKLTSFKKQNLMIFIRPIILDTPSDIDEITRKQDQVHKAKAKINQGWNKEVDDVIQLLNL